MGSPNSWEVFRAIGLAIMTAGLLPMLAAGRSQFPTNWSFEADAPGTEYVDINGDGPDGWGGDASSTTSAMAVVVAEDYTNQYAGPYSLTNAAHTKVLAYVGSIRNIFRTYPDTPLYTNVIIDVMMKPGHYSTRPLLDSNPQVAAYVNTAGHVVVKHAYYNADWSVSTAWTELDHDPIGTSDWTRITLVMDYLSASLVNPQYEEYEHFYTIAVNGGTPITNALAYTSPTISDAVADRGGSWFMTADAGTENPDNKGGRPKKWFTSVEFQGAGSIDDLVVDATGERTDTPWPPWPPDEFQKWYDRYELTEGVFGDDDDDGAQNWQEFFAGTIPNDPASVFKVIAQMLVDGTNWVYWLDGTSSVERTDFVMCRSTNLLGDWDLVGSNIPRSTTGTNMWPDSSPPAGPVFYRPRVPTPWDAE